MGCNGNTLRVEGEEYPAGVLPPLALFRGMTGGYFETMGMRILRGRSIDRSDVDRQEPVAVISQALAKSAFKGQDPIGRRVASNQPPRGNQPAELHWLTVVGVVNDHPMRALNEPDGDAVPVHAVVAWPRRRASRTNRGLRLAPAR